MRAVWEVPAGVVALRAAQGREVAERVQAQVLAQPALGRAPMRSPAFPLCPVREVQGK